MRKERPLGRGDKGSMLDNFFGKEENLPVMPSSSHRPNVLKILRSEETHFAARCGVPHSFDLGKSLSS